MKPEKPPVVVFGVPHYSECSAANWYGIDAHLMAKRGEKSVEEMVALLAPDRVSPGIPGWGWLY